MFVLAVVRRATLVALQCLYSICVYFSPYMYFCMYVCIVYGHMCVYVDV